MNAGMELMGMKECRECGDPYTPAEPDTGVCSCCIMSHEFVALRARVAELERERDEARSVCDGFRNLSKDQDRAIAEARADAARLREALRGLLDHGCLCAVNDREEPCQQCAAARAALASAPSASATPRDMRVAEAVREAERLRCLRVGSAFIGMMSPREPFGCADMSRFARAERDTPTSDLAAVVAKAVGP